MDQLQATAFKALLTQDGWLQYSTILTPDILIDNLARSLYKHIESLHKKVPGRNLSIEDLRLDIAATYRQGESRAEELTEAIEQLEYITTDTKDAVIKETICKYAQRQHAAGAARYIATHLGETELDLNIPAGLIQRAMEVGQQIDAEIHGIAATPLPGECDDRRAICPLGLAPELDNMLDGGVASGELCVFLAPPKRGKTTYLCTIGARAAMGGKRVLHITFELEERRIRRRYETAWTGLKYHEMIAAPQTVQTARDKVLETGGEVYIQDWNHHRNKSPQDIKALVSRLRAQGREIDVVIIDYLALMKPDPSQTWSRKEVRHVYGDLTKDMRAAASGMGLPVITAWQINREGDREDTPGKRHVAESWDVVMDADMLLPLAQTPAEKQNKVMRLVIEEQRISDERGVIYLHSDMGRCDIKPLHSKSEEITKIENQCTCNLIYNNENKKWNINKIDPRCPIHGSK
jgi:replicative DNA helicase